MPQTQKKVKLTHKPGVTCPQCLHVTNITGNCPACDLGLYRRPLAAPPGPLTQYQAQHQER